MKCSGYFAVSYIFSRIKLPVTYTCADAVFTDFAFSAARMPFYSGAESGRLRSLYQGPARRYFVVHDNGIWACATGNHDNIADNTGKRLTAKYQLQRLCFKWKTMTMSCPCPWWLIPRTHTGHSLTGLAQWILYISLSQHVLYDIM